MSERAADVLIVGAGMAGLTAARRLQEAGFGVLVLDKGRSVGGRLATRRIGPGRADHGAQFFSARSPEFKNEIDGWLDQDIVFLWSMGWSRGSLFENTDSGHPRYAVQGGMNQLAKHLAKGLDVETNVRVTRIDIEEDRYRVTTSEGRTFESKILLLTPPVPQSLALLDAGNVRLSGQNREALERIRYAPCIAGLFYFPGDLLLPEPGAIQRQAHTISWIANNRQKGISPDAALLTLHANAQFSRRHYDDEDIEILRLMIKEIDELIGSARPIESQVKRWRFSNPEVLHPDRHVQADHLPHLLFAGDAFDGARVEGAYLSGRSAADAIISSQP